MFYHCAGNHWIYVIHLKKLMINLCQWVKLECAHMLMCWNPRNKNNKRRQQQKNGKKMIAFLISFRTCMNIIGLRQREKLSVLTKLSLHERLYEKMYVLAYVNMYSITLLIYKCIFIYIKLIFAIQ